MKSRCNDAFLLPLMFLILSCVTGQHASTQEISLWLSEMASSDVEVATKASRLLLSSGESAIPILFAAKGDRRPFHGRPLGHRLSSMTVPEPSSADVGGGKVITIEAAALYIINGIYFDNPEFAQSAYLTDISLAPIDRTAANTSDRIDAAWSAVETWLAELKRTNLQALRKSAKGPLSASTMRFW